MWSIMNSLLFNPSTELTRNSLKLKTSYLKFLAYKGPEEQLTWLNGDNGYLLPFNHQSFIELEIKPILLWPYILKCPAFCFNRPCCCFSPNLFLKKIKSKFVHQKLVRANNQAASGTTQHDATITMLHCSFNDEQCWVSTKHNGLCKSSLALTRQENPFLYLGKRHFHTSCQFFMSYACCMVVF